MKKDTLECYAKDYYYGSSYEGQALSWEELSEETKQLYRNRILYHFPQLQSEGTDDERN